MNRSGFDAVRFIDWIESILDFFMRLFGALSSNSDETTTVSAEETTVELPIV